MQSLFKVGRSTTSPSSSSSSSFSIRSYPRRNIRRDFSTAAAATATELPKSTTVVRYATHGAPQEVLKVTTENLPPNLQPNQILVKMLAAPINPADLNMVEGTYGIKPTLPAVAGNEGVGQVVAVGSNVHGLKLQDRVIPLKPGLGTWRTFGVFNEKDFLRIPTDIQLEYAATVSVNPCTALRLLEDFVQLKAGDVVIQNGSNSMVGMAVAQIAAFKKLKTINVIRSRPNHVDAVERLKALGAHIVVTEDYVTTPQFKRLISDLPKPKLALNCVGGTSATELVRVLDDNGVMVTYGGMSRKPVTVPTSQFIFKNVTLKGFWLSKWLETHSLEERTKMLETVFEYIRLGDVRLWMETWKFSQFGEALAKAQEPYKERKPVLKME